MSSQTKSGELRDVSTRALVRELKTREGVKLLLLTSECHIRIPLAHFSKTFPTDRH